MIDKQTLDLVLDLLNENKTDLKSLRQSSHDINNELNAVNGQLMLLRQAQETQKEDSKEKFADVHKRIDTEQESIRKLVEEKTAPLAEITKTLDSMKPAVGFINTVKKFGGGAIVLFFVAGLIWASVPAFVAK